MRSIKYRARIADSKSAQKYKIWEYGYVSRNRQDEWFIDTLDERYYKVDGSTIGEYTGFKDNTSWNDLSVRECSDWLNSGKEASEWNGKEIFENDILEVSQLTCDSDRLPEKLIVKFVGGMFQLFRGDECLNGLHLLYLKECRVIGNITDNPELIAG